jgi:DNA-binding GntR family transcriptional regulator
VDQPVTTAPICALTLPQQIADHLGHRIMTGELVPGSRLKEEEFAELYDVSRGPVREAFRILERRGFVEIVPRHGARVRVFDPADLAGLFSIRAVLFGLAARQAAEQGAPELVDLLAEQVARLRQSAETMEISPREHATIAGDSQHLIARFSGNRPLLRMLEEMTSRALWRMAWRDTPLDLTTRVRRQQSARLWSDLLKAIEPARTAATDKNTIELKLAAAIRTMAVAINKAVPGKAVEKAAPAKAAAAL